jgi:hypothetical protein
MPTKDFLIGSLGGFGAASLFGASPLKAAVIGLGTGAVYNSIKNRKMSGGVRRRTIRPALRTNNPYRVRARRELREYRAKKHSCYKRVMKKALRSCDKRKSAYSCYKKAYKRSIRVCK